MLAREVEQLQIINLLKTLGPSSPITPILLQAVVENSSLPNRERILQQIAQSMQPNPEEEQMNQMNMQMMVQNAQLELKDKEAKVMKTQAEAENIMVETQLMPDLTRAKLAAALSNNLKAGDADDKEFERRAKVAELMLKEKDIDLKEKDIMQNTEIVKMQMQNKT
jgi:hypothetical protein